MDDSPYIYHNSEPLTPADMALLRTSHQNEDYSQGMQSKYVDDLQEKLDYMKFMRMANRSAMCMSVLLSYFTRPVWTPVGCKDKLKHNYFVCERKFDVHTFKEYVRSSMCCPTYHTYANGSCWYVSTNVKKTNSPVVTVQLSKLFSLLTAWSLGDRTRTSTWVQYINERVTCLKTDDFHFQQYKDWFVASNCNTTNLLRSHEALTYSEMCLGMPWKSRHNLGMPV